MKNYHRIGIGRLRFILLMACLALFTTSQAKSSVGVSISAEDGFALKGDWYYQQKNKKSALVLHQCNMDRSAFSEISQDLHAAGYNVLNVDFRGFGESVSEEFRFTDVLNTTREERQKMFPLITKDGKSIMDFFLQQAGVNVQSSVLLGASCGATVNIRNALENEIPRTVLLSPGGMGMWLDPKHLEMLSEKSNVSFLLVTSDNDSNTPLTEVDLLRSKSASADTQIMTYKGADHGIPLLQLDKSLMSRIIDWLER